jgi:hypothetical protein
VVGTHLALLEQVQSSVDASESALLAPEGVALELASSDEGGDVEEPAEASSVAVQR